MCCFGGLCVFSLGSSIDGWSMQDWDDLPLTSKVMVLWCAKDGSVVLKAHRSCVSSSSGLRAPLNDYLSSSLDSEWWLWSCFCFPISVLCSVSMHFWKKNAVSDVAVFFFSLLPFEILHIHRFFVHKTRWCFSSRRAMQGHNPWFYHGFKVRFFATSASR